MNELSLPNSENEPADAAYASHVVKMLFAGYPGQHPRDPDTYAAFIATLCVGKPKRIVRGLVHPETGVIAECKFLPTVAEVNEWFSTRLPKEPARFNAAEHRKFLPAPPEPEIPPEIRAARVAKLKAVAAEIRAVTESNVVGRPIKWRQTHDPEKLLAALNPKERSDDAASGD